MDSISGQMQSGIGLGRRIGGLAGGAPVAQRGNSYLEKVRWNVIKSGLAARKNTDGTYEAVNGLSPAEEKLAIHSYKQVEEQGIQAEWEKGKETISRMRNALQDFTKVAENTPGDAKLQAYNLQVIKAGYLKIMGKDGFAASGMEEMLQAVNNSIDSAEKKEKADKAHNVGMVNLYTIYRNDPTNQNWMNYTRMFYTNSDLSSESNFPQPEPLRNATNTAEDQKRKLAQSKKEKTMAAGVEVEKQRQIKANAGGADARVKAVGGWYDKAANDVIKSHFSGQKGSFEALSGAAVARQSAAMEIFNKMVSGSDLKTVTKYDINQKASDALKLSGKLTKQLSGQEPGQYDIEDESFTGTVQVFWDGEQLVAVRPSEEAADADETDLSPMEKVFKNIFE